MPLIPIPKEFRSAAFPHQIMTNPVMHNDKYFDKDQFCFGYETENSKFLQHRIQTFKASLMPDNEFINAVINNNVNALQKGKYIIDQVNKKNWNLPDPKLQNASAILIAMRLRHFNIVATFLSEKVELPKEYVAEFLHLAIKYEKRDLLELVCKTADQTGLNDVFKGYTAMEYAASKGDLESVKILWNYGNSALLQTDRLGNIRSLALAAHKGHFEVLLELIKISSVNGYSLGEAFFAALYARRSKIVEYLLNQYPMLASGLDKIGSTALINAADSNQLDIVKLLCDKYPQDCRIDFSDKDGRTALFYAVKKNALDIVDYLLKQGANANVVDKSGNTLLHAAVQNKNCVPMVEKLIAAEAVIGESNDDQLTAVDLAKQQGENKAYRILMKYLLEYHTDPLVQQYTEFKEKQKQQYDYETRLRSMETNQTKMLDILSKMNFQQENLQQQILSQKDSVKELKRSQQDLLTEVRTQLRELSETLKKLQQPEKPEQPRKKGVGFW